MNDAYIHLDAEFVKAEIAKLIEAYPELAEDESLRADTIEGQTNALRVIERALAERQDADMLAEAIKGKEAELASRRARFERRADAFKGLIKSIMKAAQLPKIQLPEATVSITKPRMSVGIENVDELPQGFFQIERKADKTAIKAAFDAGEQVPGAFQVLGSEGLSIRTK